MKKTMKASSVRSFLIILVIFLTALIGGGFYYAYLQVRSYAISVSHSVVDADASSKQIAELQSLKQELADSEQLVTKANKLFATNDNYQSQALRDVQKYAQTYGLTIASTRFDTAPAGQLDKNVVVVTLQSPVAYTKLLQFLDAIEGNLPKMQVSSISVGNTTTSADGDVTIDDIKIGVSTR